MIRIPLTELKIGTTVFWLDPDHEDPDANCSGFGTIEGIQVDEDELPFDDSVVEISKDDGGYVEALPCELYYPDDKESLVP